MLDCDTLVRTMLERTSDWKVLGILLCGSFARQDGDEASDIDIVMVVGDGNPAIWAGIWQGRHIEILLIPATTLKEHVPSRATLHGARILLDVAGEMHDLLQRLEPIFESPRIVPVGRLAYAQWEIQHGLDTLIWMAQHDDRMAILDYRDAWASNVTVPLCGTGHLAANQAPQDSGLEGGLARYRAGFGGIVRQRRAYGHCVCGPPIGGPLASSLSHSDPKRGADPRTGLMRCCLPTWVSLLRLIS